MNENVIFLVGIIIFAITIYGAVMAGGVALTKVVLQEEPVRDLEPNPPASEVSADRI
jgi:hypothetical protein